MRNLEHSIGAAFDYCPRYGKLLRQSNRVILPSI